MNDGNIWKKLRVIYRRLITTILQDVAFFAPWPLRPHLHRARGVRIGRNVYIGTLVILDEAYPEYIAIEDNVQISPGAKIATHDSSFRNASGGKLPTYIGPVMVKQNAYIGAGALILPNVTVGESAIVGAGTVVGSDIPAESIAVGNPAKVIGTIEQKAENFLHKKGLFLFNYYEKPRRLTLEEIFKLQEQFKRKKNLLRHQS